MTITRSGRNASPSPTSTPRKRRSSIQRDKGTPASPSHKKHAGDKESSRDHGEGGKGEREHDRVQSKAYADDDAAQQETELKGSGKAEEPESAQPHAEAQSEQAEVKKEGSSEVKQEDDGGAVPSPAAQKDASADEKALDIESEDDEDREDGKHFRWEVLERGHIYFWYRPKVHAAHDGRDHSPSSLDEVQNFHLLLVPLASTAGQLVPSATKREEGDGGVKKEEEDGTIKKEDHLAAQDKSEDKKTGSDSPLGYRLIRLGKKRMPEPDLVTAKGKKPGGIGGGSSEAIWAVISDVGSDVSELQGALGERRYNTKTRGERVVDAARPAGRGWYSITLRLDDRPSQRQVRLAYALSHPHEEALGEVQRELGLHAHSSVMLSMRNPTIPSTGEGAPAAGLPPQERIKLSKHELDTVFGGSVGEKGTRFARPEDLKLLREGAELLFIKKREDERFTFGAGTHQAEALQHLADVDSKEMTDDDVLKELHLRSKETPPDALDGKWI